MSFETYRQAFLDHNAGGHLWDDGTMYLYIGMIALVFIAGVFANNAKEKTAKLWFFLPAIVLIFVSGLRGINVGADTFEYRDSFENALSPNAWADKTVEPGYIFLMMCLRLILPSPILCTLFYSAISVTLVFLTFWKYKKSINLFVAFAFYIGLFYFQALDLMRIYFASSILLFNFYLLLENRYKRYLLIVLLTSQIHYSSLVMLFPMIFLWFYKKKPFIALTTAVVLSISLIPLAARFSDYIMIARYASYGEANETSEVGMMLYFEFLPFFFLVAYVLIKKVRNSWSEMLVSLTVCAFIFKIVSYYIVIAGRLGVHFMPLYIIVLPYFVKHLKRFKRQIYGPFMVFLIFYLTFRIHFYFKGYLSLDGIMPYHFFWNDNL